MDLHENVLSLWLDAFSWLFSGCLEIKYYLILLTYNLLSKMNKNIGLYVVLLNTKYLSWYWS